MLSMCRSSLRKSSTSITSCGRVGVEERRVGVDPEAGRLGLLDGGDGLVEHAHLGHRLVVPVAQAVDVHHPREVAVGLELVQVLGQQHRVGAEEDDLVEVEQPAHDLVDLRVHQRLAAGDRHHRRAALVDGVDRLLDRHPLLEQRCRLLDLAAAGALEVAGEQRLELDQQRELVGPLELLLHQVGAEADALAQGHGHGQDTSFGRVNRMSSGAATDSCALISPRPARRCDELIDKHRRCRRPGRDADRAGAGQPAQVDLVHVVDEVGGAARPLGDLDETTRVGRVGRAHDQNQVTFRGDVAYCRLSVGRGVADVIGTRRAQRREAFSQDAGDLLGLVDGEGRLHDVGDPLGVGDGESCCLGGTLDDHDVAGRFSEGALDLLVPRWPIRKTLSP